MRFLRRAWSVRILPLTCPLDSLNGKVGQIPTKIQWGLPSARAIRASVAGFRTTHSLILRTVHPFRLKAWVTCRSRRLLFSIFFFQNSVFVRGRYLQRQPCQKQPSTNTASLRPGQAKSGLPGTFQCLRYPRIPAAHRSRARGNSVVVFPCE